ncbi:MAG TPA: hypothetical protein VKB52_13735 [Rhodanobacteraceae bacterium]|nr:hypothetical protein [Rhodanobacteraceae bacterium]
MKRWLALPFGLLVAAGAGATRVDYLFADGFANAVEFPVVPLTGQVGLPTGSTIDPATLRVGNGIAETAVDATGAFTIASLEGPEMTFVLNADGVPLLAGWLDAAHTAVSARTTAEILVFVGLGGALTAPELEPQLIDIIRDDGAGALPDLEAAIAAAINADENAFAAPNDAVRQALAAALAHFLPSRRSAPGSGIDGVIIQPGEQSGLTPNQPFQSFYLTNALRRPGHAFLTRESCTFESGTVPAGDPSCPVDARNFAIDPTSGTANLNDALLDASLVIFGVEDGKPIAYTPVDGPRQGLENVPDAQKTHYVLHAVGPAAQVGLLDTFPETEQVKQLQVSMLFVVRDLIVPGILSVIIPANKDKLNNLYGFGTDGIMNDLVALFATLPGFSAKIQDGDIQGALGDAYNTFFGSATFRNQVTNLLLRLIIVTGSDPDAAFASATRALEHAETLSNALGLVDALLQSFDLGAIAVGIAESKQGDSWDIDVTGANVELSPDQASADCVSPAPELTVRVVDAAGDPQAHFVYHWNLSPPDAGELIDDAGHSGTDFDSSSDRVRVLVPLANFSGAITVEVKAYLIDGTNRVYAGKDASTVTVDPVEVLLAPRRASLQNGASQALEARVKPPHSGLQCDDSIFEYTWQATETVGTLDLVQGLPLFDAKVGTYTANGGTATGIDTVIVTVSESGQVIGSAQAEMRVEQEPTIIFGTYEILGPIPADPGRSCVDAVVAVSIPAGATATTTYWMSAYGGYDPLYWLDTVTAFGPPFGCAPTFCYPPDTMWLLSGGCGPDDGIPDAIAALNARFASGWVWEITVQY